MHSMTQENTLLLAGSTRTPTLITRRRLISAEPCWRPRAFPRLRRATASCLTGSAGSERSTPSRSSRPAPTPQRWCAIYASTTSRSSRSTSRTRTPAVVSARATRSTRRWPPACSRPARPSGPKQTDGIVESIRLLRVARQSAVKSRSAALVQIRDLIITAPQELRDQLYGRKTLRGKDISAPIPPVGRELGSPSQAAKFALRSIAQRIQALDQESRALDRQLGQLVATAAPRTIQLLGISTGHAGQLLVTAGRTSSGSAARARSRRSAAPTRSLPPRARRPATASTTAATAKPTARFT